MKNKKIIKIIISSIIYLISFLLPKESLIYFVMLILSYTIISYDIFIDAFKTILKGEIFDENMLMIIATISAFIIKQYPEAVMVMLLFEIGEYLSDMAIDSSKKSITKLMDLRSDYANICLNDKINKTDIFKVKIGDVFICKPGEKIPLDGIIISGESDIDTSSLTGESIPKTVHKGDKVLSGCINNSNVIKVKVTSKAEDSTASKVIKLIENSNERKTKTEKFITKFSKIYTPVVVILALLIAIIPSLIMGNTTTWIYRSLVFLVTSCPCALVISVPLGFFCGIGKASKEGILIKGSSELESLTKIKAIVLDKTGTLTKGNFEVTKIYSKIGEENILKIAAYGEHFSNHPIAKSIEKKYNKAIDEKKVKEYKEISGQGISAKIDNKNILIGNAKLMNENHILFEPTNELGTIIYVAVDSNSVGYLAISDEIKKEAYSLVNALSKEGINNVIMLSGDNVDIASKVSNKLKIKEFYGNLLPQDKAVKLNEIKQKGFTAFVGDGINDAPVIKLSDIGIAMGALGSDAAIEAADIVLMHDDLNKIPLAIKIAKKTIKTVKFNIIFALSFKILMLILATAGYATIWMAVFADVGITLLSILNSLKIMHKNY